MCTQTNRYFTDKILFKIYFLELFYHVLSVSKDRFVPVPNCCICKMGKNESHVAMYRRRSAPTHQATFS